MSDFTLSRGKTATIPVKAVDQFGNPIAVPVGLSASSSDESILTVAVGADGASVVVTSVAEGSATVTIVDGPLTATLSVDITVPVEVPVAVALSFDLANAVITDTVPAPAPQPEPQPIDPNAS